MDTRGTTQYLQLTTRDWVQPLFQTTLNEHACMLRSSWLFIGTYFTLSFFYDICSIKHRPCCKYSSQNIFKANNLNWHKKPILSLNMSSCSQSIQQTWWPVANTTIVTGSYCLGATPEIKQNMGKQHQYMNQIQLSIHCKHIMPSVS